jgi:predicted peptidase
MKQFNGDSHRVYLTGHSMGGYGTWEFGANHAAKFAALVVVCGGIRPLAHMPELPVSLTTDPKIADPYAEKAGRIGGTPVWIFHASDDPCVPVEEARKMPASLKAENPDVKYTEYAGVDHNSWDKACAESDLVPWLLARSLKNRPLH